ncbi:NUDIX hydrolase [Actinomyces sp. MRS3W]|uniref:NUDIX hydrolase n=1 Tax=Actinomyces sp. MRS3W TaxID=2800796 RepID=UPI0028FD9D3F|nr:NUDIX domain-containing protein [Actinomyces sp. MRS3W]MDU0349391.1 NUDIX domain-containing protein [Actinomyces sp. MRS3W]
MPPLPGSDAAAPPFALVPAAYVLLLRPRKDAGTEVLLQLRRNTGFMDGHWAAGIAGHVEPGESVTAAAVREGAEEVGVVVDPGELEPLTVIHRSNAVGGPPREQRVDFFFTLTHWRGTPTILEPARCGGLRWFPLDALPEPIPPHELTAFTALATALDGGQPVPAITSFGFAGR